MRLIDKAPALFITICFVVLYVTVGVEAMMLASGALVFMWVTFGLVVLVAAGICAWMFRLLGDGAPAPEVTAAAAPERVAPAVTVVAQRPASAPAPRLVMHA
jgi:hypothetical protein